MALTLTLIKESQSRKSHHLMLECFRPSHYNFGHVLEVSWGTADIPAFGLGVDVKVQAWDQDVLCPIMCDKWNDL